MTSEQMEDVLRRTVAAIRTWNEREGLANEDHAIVAAAPATAAALGALIGSAAALPPSYLQLLSIHDGIRGIYRLGGDILPSNYRGEYDQQFSGSFDLSRVHFFAMDDDGSAAVFDLSAIDEAGEREVLEVTNYRELCRYHSFDEFLLDYLVAMESSVSGKPFTSIGRPERFSGR